jgi:hypothetical protein
MSPADKEPAIRMHSGKIFYINPATLDMLGRPRYLRFFRSENEKMLLIGCCDERDRCSYKIGDYYYTNGGRVRIKDNTFIKAILNMTGWDSETFYCCKGEYVPSLNMVAFHLDAAEREKKTNKPEEETDYE